MKSSSSENRVTQECPQWIADKLKDAGGLNPYGEPMFRLVWGWNRIVPMTGEWQEWEKMAATLTDKVTGIVGVREFIRLKSSVVETRQVPKYLPANCWHLEMWRPPEEYACYGPKENWTKLGQEVIGGMTIDCAGEFPERGEYELCYPITDDLTVNGQPIPLAEVAVDLIVRQILAGRNYSMPQRKSAIEQRIKREEAGFSRKVIDILKDGMPVKGGKIEADMKWKAEHPVVLP